MRFAEFRTADGIKPGEEFEVDRIGPDQAVVTLNRRDFDAAGVSIVDPRSEPDG